MSGIDHLLDTNVVIGLLKGHDAAVGLAREAGLVLGRAGVSQITRMELLGFPALTPEEDRAARAFLSLCKTIGIHEDIEHRAIQLRRAGALKLPDAVVAATALCMQAKLLTLDQRLARVVAHISDEGARGNA